MTGKTYIAVYFGSAFLAILATPVLTRVARAKGLMDRPGVRKVHKTPVPRIGGVVIALAAIALVLPVLALDNVIGEAFRKVQAQIVVLLVTGTLVFLVGLADDLGGVGAPLKLLVLAGCSLAVCLSGARIDEISLGGLGPLELGWLSWPVTILWIVTVTVGMNFIDGLDGLAAGIAAIVCGAIAVFAFYTGQIVMAVLMLALLGSLTGFLFFNFNPAKVFMGDSGSMFLGFIIGAGSVVCVAKAATLAGIAIPAAALGVPLFDTMFTMVRRRILDRRSMFTGERGHIHHRLLDLGLNQRHAVIVLYLATLLAATIGMTLLVTRRFGTIAVMAGVVALLLLLFHFVGAARIRETMGAIRRNAAIARQEKHEKGVFEDAQLRMREATSFDGLWQVACLVGEQLGFERLALSRSADGQGASAVVWQRSGSGDLPPRDQVVAVSIPIRNGLPESTLWLDAALKADGSLEAAGRRVTLLARLLDECLATRQHLLDGLSVDADAGPAAARGPGQDRRPADANAEPREPLRGPALPPASQDVHS